MILDHVRNREELVQLERPRFNQQFAIRNQKFFNMGSAETRRWEQSHTRLAHP